MRLPQLERATHEARRFLDAAANARQRLLEDEYAVGKETAAAKRASLDLTRALAKMRKP